MAFRYLYQISCSSNIPCGYWNNTNVRSIYLSSSLTKQTLSHQEQCLQNLNTQVLNCSLNSDYSKPNVISISNKEKNQEFIEKEDYVKETEFLTSNKYYLQDSQRLEKSYEVSNNKKSLAELSYLQPAKLQPYSSSSNFCSVNFGTKSFFSLTDNKNYSSVNNDATSNSDLEQCVIEKSTIKSKNILDPVSTIRTTDIRQFSTKRDYDCDCPPTASRNLTTIDSLYINLKPPNDVPPLAQKKQRCQTIEASNKCLKVKERIPRADDCYEVKFKKLPTLCSKTCPVIFEQLKEGKPLLPLKKHPVQEPLKCCKKNSFCESNIRADDCLKVEQRTLPKIKFSNCPKIENCIYDVKPLKPLKKLYECEPQKIPPEPETCNLCDRADTKTKFSKPFLPKIKFDFVPSTTCTAPPKIPLKRLPNVEGKDLPKNKCVEVEEKCVRSDDVTKNEPHHLLPMIILKPENNCVSIRPKKRMFTSVKRKYSILSAIKSPWTLSVLTANVIAFNYYHKIKLDTVSSTEKNKFENEVKRNLSQIPTKTLKKKFTIAPSQIKIKSSKSDNICFNGDDAQLIHKKALTTNSKQFSDQPVLNTNSKSVNPELKKLKRLNDNKNFNDKIDDFLRKTPKYSQSSLKILPATLPWKKFHNYSQLSIYKDFSKSATSNLDISNQINNEQMQRKLLKTYYQKDITNPLNKKLKNSFLIYSVNNYRKIHSSAKHYDKKDKNQKCGNKNCIKIKWPGLPPRQVTTCQKEYKHRICKKVKCPYPSFSEFGSVGKFPTCECTELPKQLQPKYKILPKLQLIKAAPPEWSRIDSDQEMKCVTEKLKMQPGETRTCENFYCPPRHIGTEYLSEEEKQCPPVKPKPPISCVPCPIPQQTEKRKFEFKRCPPEESVYLPNSKPDPVQTCEPFKPEPSSPPDSSSEKPYDSVECSNVESPYDKPTKPLSSNNFVDPWSTPKKKCEPAHSLLQIRLASTFTPHSSNVNLEKNDKSLWELVCTVFKTNLYKSCEEIKSICKKLSNQSKSKSEIFINRSNPTKSSRCKNEHIFNEVTKNYNLKMVNNNKVSHNNSLQNNRFKPSVKTKKTTSNVALAVLQSPKCLSTVINIKNKPIWNNLCNFRKASSKPKKIKNILISKTGNEYSLKYNNFKKCDKKVKLDKNCSRFIKHSLKRTEKVKYELATSQTCKKSNIFANSNFCQLSTTSKLCKNNDSNSWKQKEKSKPGILDKVETQKSFSEEVFEAPISSDGQDTNGKSSSLPDCKTPIMKVCSKHRDQTTCAKEYVHPKCEAQKAPFPSFSECHPPFPKFPLTECEVQRRNLLIAKQKLEMYSKEKPKHKYCVRCNTKCNKQYSTLAFALRSLGYNHSKRYFSSAKKIKDNLAHIKNTTSLDQKPILTNEKIKTGETDEKKLDKLYYKLITFLESYPEQEVYNLFDNPCNNLPMHQNNKHNVIDYYTNNYDKIDIDQLYQSFYTKIDDDVTVEKENRLF